MVDGNDLIIEVVDNHSIPLSYSFSNFKDFDKELAYNILKVCKNKTGNINSDKKYVTLNHLSSGAQTFLTLEEYNGLDNS